MFAWYESGKFDLANHKWANTIEKNGNDAQLGSGLTEFSESGNGAAKTVNGLKGTPNDTIFFGPVIKATFSICSVTRYTNSASAERILQGEGNNWLHGHYQGHTGLAYYGDWMTADVDNITSPTNWVVMCGTNAGSQLKLANGANVGTATGGKGDVKLWINYGDSPDQVSDFAIAEVMVWDRGLTNSEMFEASSYLMGKFGIGNRDPPKDSRAKQLFCMDSCPMYNLRLFNNGMPNSDTSTGVDVYVVNTSGSGKYQSKLQYENIKYLIDHTELDECHEKEFSLQLYDNGVANAGTSGLDIYVVNYDTKLEYEYETKKVGQAVTYSTADCPHLTLRLFSNGTDDASTESDVDVYIINENNNNMYYQEKYHHGLIQYSSSGDWEQKFQSCDDKTSVVLVSFSLFFL